jgi:hypothetical protein
MDIYTSLNGPDWHNKHGWMSDTDPCGGGTYGDGWFGVECTTGEGDNNASSVHVTGLALPHNNLVGKLPQFRGLAHLIHVDLSNRLAASVGFSNSVGGVSVDWAVGALLLEVCAVIVKSSSMRRRVDAP